MGSFSDRQIVDYRSIPNPNRLSDRSNRAYSPRIVPVSDGRREIHTLEEAYYAATVEGIKGIEAPDERYVTYLIAGITLMKFNTMEGEGTFGVATGGTFEPSRYALGLPHFMHDVFGMALPVDKIPYVETLDDYEQSQATYERLQEEIRPEIEYLENRQLPWTYRGEQLIWLSNAGFDPSQFVSPPLRYTSSGQSAARLFDAMLKEPKVKNKKKIKFTGAGIHGHWAFRERRPSLDPSKMFTDIIRLHDSTKLTNGNNFVPSFLPEEPKMNLMFRNIMAAYGLSTRKELLAKCADLLGRYNGTMPKELAYIPGSVFEDFIQNFDSYWNRALTIINRMPQYGISQGIGDSEAELQLNAQTKEHKRMSLWHTLEAPISSHWPISGLQMKTTSVVIFDEAAASGLKHRDMNFVFRPDDSTTRIIENMFPSSVIEQMFWDAYTPRIVW